MVYEKPQETNISKMCKSYFCLLDFLQRENIRMKNVRLFSSNKGSPSSSTQMLQMHVYTHFPRTSFHLSDTVTKAHIFILYLFCIWCRKTLSKAPIELQLKQFTHAGSHGNKSTFLMLSGKKEKYCMPLS